MHQYYQVDLANMTFLTLHVAHFLLNTTNVFSTAFRQTPSSANVFVVDWGALAAGPWYYTARTNSEYVALVTARLLDFLTGPGGARAGAIHLVGCGLGARVAALAATNLNRPEKIGRLTGTTFLFCYTHFLVCKAAACDYIRFQMYPL